MFCSSIIRANSIAHLWTCIFTSHEIFWFDDGHQSNPWTVGDEFGFFDRFQNNRLCTFAGLISLEFALPKELCPLGWFRIEVHAQFQVEKRLVLVENWQREKFEVFVDLAEFTNLESELTVKLNANYTNRLPVHANATIQLLALPAPNTNETGKLF